MSAKPSAGSESVPGTRAAPAFELPLLASEETVSLQAVLDDRSPAFHPGAVIVFWSAVCSHCRRYDAYLRQLPEHHGISLVVIACRIGESPRELEQAVAQRELTFPLVLDSGEVARAWGVRQTPTAFLIGHRGNILYRGAIDDFSYPGNEGHQAHLDDAISAFLSDQPIELESTPAFGCPVDSVYYRWPKVIGEIGRERAHRGQLKEGSRTEACEPEPRQRTRS